MSENTKGRTTALHLILAWAFVGIPLILGLWQTVLSAVPRFK